MRALCEALSHHLSCGPQPRATSATDRRRPLRGDPAVRCGQPVSGTRSLRGVHSGTRPWRGSAKGPGGFARPPLALTSVSWRLLRAGGGMTLALWARGGSCGVFTTVHTDDGGVTIACRRECGCLACGSDRGTYGDNQGRNALCGTSHSGSSVTGVIICFVLQISNEGYVCSAIWPELVEAWRKGVRPVVWGRSFGRWPAQRGRCR